MSANRANKFKLGCNIQEYW